jgi:hypothetical protein
VLKLHPADGLVAQPVHRAHPPQERVLHQVQHLWFEAHWHDHSREAMTSSAFGSRPLDNWIATSWSLPVNANGVG